MVLLHWIVAIRWLISVTCYLSLCACYLLSDISIWNLLKLAKTCLLSLVVVRLVIFQIQEYSWHNQISSVTACRIINDLHAKVNLFSFMQIQQIIYKTKGSKSVSSGIVFNHGQIQIYTPWLKLLVSYDLYLQLLIMARLLTAHLPPRTFWKIRGIMKGWVVFWAHPFNRIDAIPS